MSDLKTLTILFRAKTTIERKVKEDIQKHQLNPTQFGVLEALFHKGSMEIQLITQKILIANSSMSYTIKQLVLKEWIEVKTDALDKRKTIVSLTNQGRQAMEEIYPKHVKSLRSIFDRLTKEEEQTLQDLLKKIGK